jgi:hypothetical protein
MPVWRIVFAGGEKSVGERKLGDAAGRVDAIELGVVGFAFTAGFREGEATGRLVASPRGRRAGRVVMSSESRVQTRNNNKVPPPLQPPLAGASDGECTALDGEGGGHSRTPPRDMVTVSSLALSQTVCCVPHLPSLTRTHNVCTTKAGSWRS